MQKKEGNKFMIISTYHIAKRQTSNNTILLPKSITLSRSITNISFGTTVIPCKFTTTNTLTDTISIPTTLFDTLHIPFETKSPIFLDDDTLHIGPLIGIFTAGFTNSTSQPIGGRSSFFADLLSLHSIPAYTFVFGAHSIKWSEGMIRGHFYIENHWKEYNIPFPHVVYDRLPNRKTENHIRIQRIKNRIQQEYMIPWFNPGFFNKWDIYKKLEPNKKVKAYLPETSLFTSFERIEKMLAHHQHLYIKPTNGSLGSRVYQIRYEREEEAYFCRFYAKDKKKLHKYRTLEQLVNHLFKKQHLHDFIVQQGISLLRFNQQPLDFRVHTNKGRDGKWKMSAIAAKVASQGSMTTHVNFGGEVKSLEELFTEPQQRSDIYEKILHAALLLSEAIDEAVDGYIGEIGFDIGVDTNHHVWLFEANSKPGRTIFSHPSLKKYDTLTKDLFLSYATYLTEKVIQDPADLYS
jgi:YheC/D like ATP-grasp